MTREISFDVEVPGTPRRSGTRSRPRPGISVLVRAGRARRRPDASAPRHPTWTWTIEIAACRAGRSRLALTDEVRPRRPTRNHAGVATEFLVEARRRDVRRPRRRPAGSASGEDWTARSRASAGLDRSAGRPAPSTSRTSLDEHAAGFAISAPLEARGRRSAPRSAMRASAALRRARRKLAASAAPIGARRRRSTWRSARRAGARDRVPRRGRRRAGGADAFVRANLFGDDARELAARDGGARGRAGWRRSALPLRASRIASQSLTADPVRSTVAE